MATGQQSADRPAYQRFLKPWNQHRKCKHCAGVAIRDRDVCARHSGGRGVPNPSPGRLAARAVQRMETAGLLPIALVQSAPWREAGKLAFEARFSLRLVMLRRWDHRVRDPGAWASIVRQVMNDAQS